MVCQFAALNVLRLNWMSWLPLCQQVLDGSADPFLTLRVVVQLHAAPRSAATLDLPISVPVVAPYSNRSQLGLDVLQRQRGCAYSRSVMICHKCGIEDDSLGTQRFYFRTKMKTCSSCRARRSHTVRTAAGLCRPWFGETDEELNPIDRNGNLVMQGIRTCGYKDCCNPEHVISEPDVIATFRCRHRHVTATLTSSKPIVDIPPCDTCGEPTSMVSQVRNERRSS